MANFINTLKKKISYRFDKNAWLKDRMEAGYTEFLKTGITTQEAYYDLVRLFCDTNGKFNEILNNKLKSKNPPVKITQEMLTGVTGQFSHQDFKKIDSELNEQGYFHFENRLSKELCNRLYDFALSTPATIPSSQEKFLYNSEKPVSEIYRLDIQHLINNKDVQALITDPVLVNIARNYLGCEPIFDFPAMWWSTAYKKEASSDAAQLYHFDLDRIKWLKIFIYINDVTLENGPHNYIRGSHKPGAKPVEILKKGYVRLTDRELTSHYNASDIKVACGPAGTIFAGDTKCWHKGTNLKSGHRLVLEFEYASSLFGANYPKMEVVNTSPEFRKYCETNKIFASHITFKN